MPAHLPLSEAQFYMAGAPYNMCGAALQAYSDQKVLKKEFSVIGKM